MQCAQRAVAARRSPARLYLRGDLPPAHDRQGAQSRHGLVCDDRQRLAGSAGAPSSAGWRRRISTHRASSTRRSRRSTGPSVPRHETACAGSAGGGDAYACRRRAGRRCFDGKALSAGAVEGRAVPVPEDSRRPVWRRLSRGRVQPAARPLRPRLRARREGRPEIRLARHRRRPVRSRLRCRRDEAQIFRRRQGGGRRQGDRHLHPRAAWSAARWASTTGSRAATSTASRTS